MTSSSPTLSRQWCHCRRIASYAAQYRHVSGEHLASALGAIGIDARDPHAPYDSSGPFSPDVVMHLVPMTRERMLAVLQCATWTAADVNVAFANPCVQCGGVIAQRYMPLKNIKHARALATQCVTQWQHAFRAHRGVAIKQAVAHRTVRRAYFKTHLVPKARRVRRLLVRDNQRDTRGTIDDARAEYTAAYQQFTDEFGTFDDSKRHLDF